MENWEIDKLVAEKVMGLHGITFKNREFMVEVEDSADEYKIFSPSTNIQDAWLVVEKLRKENEYWFELGTDKSFSLKYKCYFQLDDMESEVVADTAPMSICLAALKSVGITI